MQDDYLTVGSVTSAHGVKGEVKVFPLTDDPGRFGKCREYYLDLGNEIRPLHLQGVKYSGRFVILKFEEFSNRNDVENLHDKKLLVDRKHAVKLDKDEYFIADLIGIPVYEKDRFVGTLTEVMPTGANDVYVVKKENGRELLLPAIRECILDVDIEGRKMTVYILPGLEEEE